MLPGMWPPGLTGSFSGAGPIRTHQGRPGNGVRSNGPYGRPDGRNARQSSFSARSGAYEGGAAAIGPPQATLGRTVRSYEDLDAAGPAAKEEELDY